MRSRALAAVLVLTIVFSQIVVLLPTPAAAIDTVPPTISILSPQANAAMPANFTITVNANDDTGIADVTYVIDYTGASAGTFHREYSSQSAPYSVQADLIQSIEGTHTLTATVTDLQGLKASTTVRFVLDKTIQVIDPRNVTFAFVEQEPSNGEGSYHFRWVSTGVPDTWVNDLDPNIAFAAASTVAGIAYTLDRKTGTVPVMPTPGSKMAYAPLNWKPGGSLTPLGRATLDMRGWLAKQSTPYSLPGMADPVEGVWYVHARTVEATSGVMGVPAEFAFGLDITKPDPVRGLRFSDSAGAIISDHRRDVVWDNGLLAGGEYDHLSGDSRFAIYLNGRLLQTAKLVRTERYQSVSIESLEPGMNVIGVAAMDAAGNEGPVQEIVTYVNVYPPNTPLDLAFADPDPEETSDYHFRWVDGAVPNLWIKNPEQGIAFKTSAAEDTVDGFLYTVDRTRGTVPSTPAPGSNSAYAPLNWKSPANVELSLAQLDLRGWLERQSGNYSIPGMEDPVEGVWYVHARTFIAKYSKAGPPKDFAFGVDVTPPKAVTGLRFSDDKGITIGSKRRDIIWDNGTYLGTPYDSLSGDSRFVVYVNGTPKVTTRMAYNSRYMFASVESFSVGKNIIGVSAMDAAGNEGPKREIVMYSDPDTPTIDILTPTPNQVVPRRVLMSVDATDKGGIAEVRYEVDGKYVGRSTRAPYSITADLKNFANGTHVLKAMVKDMYGRTAFDTQKFRLDKTAPTISSIKVGPADFYPLIKDGYFDSTSMKFKLSEQCLVKFQVLDSSGRLVYTTSATRKPGTTSFRWSGQGITAEVAAQIVVAKYSLRLVAKDAAGNVTTSKRYQVTIRSYEIVKTGPDTAKVVPR